MLTSELLHPTASTQGLATVLVHAGVTQDSECLIRSAVGLANAFGAKLLGVSTPPGPTSIPPHAGSACEQEAATMILDAAGARFTELSARVRAGASWRAAEGPPAVALTRLAWAADMIMTNIRPPIDDQEPGSSLKSLVVTSRRPVLARPLRASRSEFDRIAVLWEPSSACARAVTAALPLIGRARRTTVLVESHHVGHAPAERLDELRHGLELRGLNIDVEVVEHGVGRDRSHRRATERLDADLIVMAAWRGQMSWLSLADDTDAVLASSDTFALLSH